MTKTNGYTRELEADIAGRIATVGGLTKEIQQGVDGLLGGPGFEEVAEKLIVLLRVIEYSMRQAGFMATGKAELLTSKPVVFDGQVLSRIGEVDLYV